MSQLKNFIRDASKQLHVGESIYLDCPTCGRKKKLGLTKFADKVLYRCFNADCGLRTRGIFQPPSTTQDMLNLLNKDDSSLHQRREFEIPKHWLQGFQTVAAIEMAMKYGLMQAPITFYTDIQKNRLVWVYKNIDGKVTGACGRALATGMAKAYVYPDSIVQPVVVGDAPVGVVVEDCFSAVRASNAGYTGIALSGTVFRHEWLKFITKYKQIIVALDNDATTKSLDIRKLLQFYVEDVRIVQLKRDLKDMTREEVVEWIK